MKEKYKIVYSGLSDVGKLRKNNQDNYCVNGQYNQCIEATHCDISGELEVEGNIIFAVFDGMGGEENGEKAAYIAAETTKFWQETRTGEDLRALCYMANQSIVDFGIHHNTESMATTAAMIEFTDNKVRLCNVGDSRLYEIKNGDIIKLSKDHTLRTTGKEKAPLYQYIGMNEKEGILEPFYDFKDMSEATYLICSDGLTDMVDEETILRTIYKNSLEEAKEKLFSLAIENGGYDNITFIICQVEKACIV